MTIGRHPYVSPYIAGPRRLLGLENPNPGLGRFQLLNQIHPSPPLVLPTQPGSQASSIASAVLVGPTDTRLQYLDAPVALFPSVQTVGPGAVPMVSVGGGTGENPLFHVRFMTDAPVLEPNWNNRTGTVRVRVDGQWVPDVPNQIANPRFLTNTSGWAAYNGATLARDTSTYLFAPAAMSITCTSAAYSGCQYDTGVTFAVSTLYEAGIWLRANDGGIRARVVIENAANNRVAAVHTVILGTDWQYFRFSGVSPSNATGTLTLAVDTSAYTAGNGQIIWIGAASVCASNAVGLPQPAPYTDPGDNLWTVLRMDFAGVRQWRQIDLYFSGDARFGGVYVGPVDTVYPSYQPTKPRVIVATDSWSENNVLYQGFVKTMGEILGWQDVWNSASGGTGYVNAGSRVNLQSRYVTDIINNNPDIVILATGQNDTASSPATIQAAVTTVCAGIKAALPNVKLIVVGPFSLGSPNSTKVLMRDAVYAGALGYMDIWIDPIGGTLPYDGTIAHYANSGWMTGTGRSGALTGSGNGDVLIWTDSHPDQAGSDYLGQRLAQAIASGMPF